MLRSFGAIAVASVLAGCASAPRVPSSQVVELSVVAEPPMALVAAPPGRREQSLCDDTPCVLSLRAGEYALVAVVPDRGRFALDPVFLRRPAQRLSLRWGRLERRLWAGGVVAALGVAPLVGGIALAASSDRESSGGPRLDGYAGTWIAAAGAGLVVIGLALLFEELGRGERVLQSLEGVE